MDFDDIFSFLGEFGKYQIRIFILAGVIAFFGAFNTMSIVFLAGEPLHRCAVPGLEVLNLTEEQILNTSIPQENKDIEMVWSQCYMYNRNYTGWSQDDVINDMMPNSNKSTWPRKPCERWVYDQSLYTSTIVTMYDLVCDKRWLQATASSVYMAGLMAGVFLSGTISDLFRRRRSLCVSVIAVAGFAISIAFSTNYVMFVTLRFFLALADSAAFTIGFVLLIEFVGPNRRVDVGIGIEYFWAVGYLIVTGVAYLIRDFFRLQLALSCPLLLYLIYVCLIPESPRWLYVKERKEEANKILYKMSKFNQKSLPKTLNIVVNKSKSTATVLGLLRMPKMRWKSLNIFFNWFVNSLVYYGLSLNTSNLGGNPYINFCISGAVEIPAYIFCQMSLKYFGRKLPLGGSMIFGGVALLCTLAVPQNLNVISIVLAMAGKFCISASFAIIWVFSAELFPTEVRNVGVGTGSMSARIGGVVAPYIGQLSGISIIIPMIIFGASSVTAGLLALLLPETKDTNLPETIMDGETFGRNKKTKAVRDNGTENSGFAGNTMDTYM